MTDPVPQPGATPIANAPSGPQPESLDRDHRPPGTPDRTLHMVGHAHLDPVWLWPWQEGYAEARATFWSAIMRMDEYPDFVFTCDQVVLLSWVEESDPELFERIRQRVAEGRWQLVGGWWVEPDCNMPAGESFVRQGLYGQRYLKDKFDITATVGMNADPFGHNAMLPQILRGQGMDSYCFLRPGPHEEPQLGTAFRWQSPDGSQVLAYRIPNEYGSSPGDVSGQVDKSLAAVDQGLGDLMIFYGVGNHGGGPTKANIESIHRYDRMGTFGRMIMSSPRRYFDELIAAGSNARAELPVWRSDLQHHAPGCYSAHSGIKAWQRRAQAAILSAERWAAVGSIAAGLDYPRSELARAWQQILFNQFHDILPGSAIESAYDDARDQLGEAVAIAKRTITRTHNVIASHVNIPAEPATQPVLIFNPHPWPVTAQVDLQYGVQPTGVRVLDADGAVTPSQRIQSTATTDDKSRGATVFDAEVPALGYRLYRLRPLTWLGGLAAEPRRPLTRVGGLAAEPGEQWSGAPPGNLTATDRMLENDLLWIQLDPETGWLTSLLDKRTGLDLVAGATGPHTQICADPTDTWGHRVVSYAWPGEEMRTCAQLLAESGPVRAIIRVTREWGRSTMVEEFVLSHRSDALEVRVTLDWREQAHLLKMRFPVAVTEPEATYEIPFGSLERPVNGNEDPAQSWVDLAGIPAGRDGRRRAGLAVVNNAKHGFDVSPGAGGDGPSIGMTAVRSPVYSWHDPRLLDPDGCYTYQDQGVQKFRYLLVPHAGDWREAGLMRRSAELGSPVRAMLESFHDGPLPDQLSFASDGGGSVMVTAIKGSEDEGAQGADLIVRAVETTGRAASARIELPLAGRVLEAEFSAHQIRTFSIPASVSAPVVETDLIEWPLGDRPKGDLREQPLPGGRLRFDRAHSGHPGDEQASDLTEPAEGLGPGQSDPTTDEGAPGE